MKKKSQYSSTLDFLLNNLYLVKGKSYGHSKSADSLFSIWKNSSLKISNNIFNKPSNIKDEDLENMKNEGLIEIIGNKIKITAKGSDVIKVMVLGDDKSIFEKNKKQVTYSEAKENVKKTSKSKRKKKTSNWLDSLFQ